MEEQYNQIFGKVYKLTSNETDDVYIGSTTIPLYKRFHIHKYGVKRNPNLRSHALFKHEDVKISCIYEGFFDNRKQLYDMERQYIQSEPNCVNKTIPSRTRKQYYADNRESELAKSKEYRLNNLEEERNKDRANYHKNKDVYRARKNLANRLCETIQCDVCGGCFKHCNKLKHIKTIKHQSGINLLQ